MISSDRSRRPAAERVGGVRDRVQVHRAGEHCGEADCETAGDEGRQRACERVRDEPAPPPHRAAHEREQRGAARDVSRVQCDAPRRSGRA